VGFLSWAHSENYDPGNLHITGRNVRYIEVRYVGKEKKTGKEGEGNRNNCSVL